MKDFWGTLPIVTTLHHDDSATDLAPFHQSDGVMTVSTQWKKYLTRRGIDESRQVLVPFGVDTDIFHLPQNGNRKKIRQQLGFTDDNFILGISSRRMSNGRGRKGMDCFFHALKSLQSHLPNLSTVIIGPGWKALAQHIRRQGIPCALTPFHINHHEVAHYYQALDLFWVTSRVEGGPVPLLEAMASGVPCLSTPVGAALDLIKHGENGFLIPFDSSDHFVDCSLNLAQNPLLRSQIGQAARNTIMQERRWEHTGEKLLELYACAIKNFSDSSTRAYCHPLIQQHPAPDIPSPSEKSSMKPEVFRSSKVQNWIAICEHLNGIRQMLAMKEWSAAFRFGLQTLQIAPLDLNLWIELISIMLKSRKFSTPNIWLDEAQPLAIPKPES